MRFSSDSNRKKGEDLVKLKIKDIAKKAGVSTTAVSFALNGKADKRKDSTHCGGGRIYIKSIRKTGETI